jgi:hypothetical protein
MNLTQIFEFAMNGINQKLIKFNPAAWRRRGSPAHGDGGVGASAHRRRRATVGAATATAVRRRRGVDGRARTTARGRRARLSAISDLIKYSKEISSKQIAGDLEKFWKNSWR